MLPIGGDEERSRLVVRFGIVIINCKRYSVRKWLIEENLSEGGRIRHDKIAGNACPFEEKPEASAAGGIKVDTSNYFIPLPGEFSPANHTVLNYLNNGCFHMIEEEGFYMAKGDIQAASSFAEIPLPSVCFGHRRKNSPVVAHFPGRLCIALSTAAEENCIVAEHNISGAL